MNIPTLRHWSFLVALSLGVIAASAPVAWAQSPSRPKQQDAEPPAGARSQIEVLVVHATHSGKTDPQLRSLAKNLAFTKYTGFDLLGTYPARLAAGQQASFDVPGGLKLRLDLLERLPDNMVKVRVRMMRDREKVTDMTASVPRHRDFITGGLNHGDGKLILVLSIKD